MMVQRKEIAAIEKPTVLLILKQMSSEKTRNRRYSNAYLNTLRKALYEEEILNSEDEDIFFDKYSLEKPIILTKIVRQEDERGKAYYILDELEFSLHDFIDFVKNKK